MRLVGDLVLAGFGQLKNARVENLAADPVTPQLGQVWYNTTDNAYRGYNGTAIVTLATGGSTAVLQAEIDQIEAAAGLGEDGTYSAPVGSNYLGSTLSLKGAAEALDAQAKVNADAIAALASTSGSQTTAISALQDEVDLIEASVGLEADGTYVAPVGSNYLGSTTSLKGATVALDTQVKANTDAIAQEVLDRAADVTAEEDRAVAAEALKVNKAGDVMSGNLNMSGNSVLGVANPVNADDAANKQYVDSLLAGLDFQADVLGTETDFVAQAGRYIVVDNSTFIEGATGASAGDIVTVDASGNVVSVDYDVSVAGEGAITWNRTSATFVVLAGGVWSDFGGLAGVTAGVGLGKTGSTMYVNLGAGISELPTDEIGIDVRATGGLMLTEDGTSDSNAGGAQLAVRLDGSTLTVGASGLKVADAEIARITALETGLAQEVLDRAADVTAEEDRATGVEASLQAEIDAVEAAVGLNVDGTLAAFSATNYLNALTNLRAAAIELDTQLKAVSDAASAVNTRLTNSQFLYDGTVAATVHTVTHNLGVQYCQVVVVDSADKVVIPDAITFNTSNQLTVEFISAITCKVVASAPKA